MKDNFGLEISTNNAECVDWISKFNLDVIRYSKEFIGHLKKARECDPSSITPRIFLASFRETKRKMFEKAEKLKRKIDQGEYNANERERLILEGLSAFGTEDNERAAQIHLEIVSKYPTDMYSVKRGQICAFYACNAKLMFAIAEKAYNYNPDQPYLKAMYAFALGETGKVDEAEKIARQALKENESDPWCHHALAHCLLGQGKAREGADLLKNMSHHWDGLTSFMYTHNWWHLTLFYSDLCEPVDKILEIYDKRLWTCNKNCEQDQFNVSLLLVGLDVHDVCCDIERMKELTEYLTVEDTWHIELVLDLMIVYIFARLNMAQNVQIMEDSMRKFVHDFGKSEQFLTLWLTASKAIQMYVASKYAESCGSFEKVVDHTIQFGGSQEQRDIVQDIYIAALSKSDQKKHWEQARQILLKRLEERRVPMRLRQLAGVEEKLGNTPSATALKTEAEKSC
jgi:tetratricopeptide (TPR) repeat protein